MFLFGGMANQGQQQPALSGVQFQTSVYGKCIPIVYGTNRIAPNVIWYGDFTATAVPQQGGGKGGVVGGGTGKGGGGSAGYTYKTSLAYGLCEGPIQGAGSLYIDKNVTTLSAQGFSLFTGTYPQTAWTYLTTNHPTQALGYNGLAYIAVANYSLGNSANLPNHNVEVKGIYSTSVGVLPDADPSLVINDLLTNAIYGVGFPSSKVGSLTTYQNYTLATGLLISPAYTTQQQSSQMIDDLVKNTNSAIVWSSGTLNIVPYGDVDATGNGKTYTAPAAPLYNLTDDDFMPQSGADPVMLTRKRQSDQINSIKMEYNDNTNNYNINIVEVKDQASIDQYGLRQDSSNNSHLYTNPTAAQTAAQLLLQRQSIRNIYTFTLDQRYILLDPMDIVTLTDTNLGLAQQWVRILTIDEQDDYSLVFTAEEYLQGTGSPAIFSFQTSGGFTTNYNADPGLANTPIIFEAPVQIATNTGLETWMAVSGGSLWGGCDVYISSDNTTYQYVGTMNGNSRMGVLGANLPSSVADPDTSDTLSVNLTQSRAELLSGTQEDADLGNTVCYVDGELIAYETATLTSSYNYNLTYLNRAMYGTINSSHTSGTNFARLDNQIFVYNYDKTQIGKTIYVKLCGFNIYGGGRQSLADVVAYSHVIVGPNPPSNVTNFNVKQNGDAVVFSWNDVIDFALAGYFIGYAPQGTTDWSQFTMLTESMKGTEMTNANVPPGAWTFAIRAIDIADQLSPSPTYYDLTVTNQNSTITVQEQAPDYPGIATVNGFVRHWSGVLIPDDQGTAGSYIGTSNFMVFCPTPVSTCTYTTPTFNVGYDANLRIFATDALVYGVGQSSSVSLSTAVKTYLDAWISSDTGVYNEWTIGSLDFQYANMRVKYNPVAGSVGILNQFSMTIDAVPISETSPQTVAISSLGTTVTFPAPFHTVPFVVPLLVSSSPGYATAANITTTTAEIFVWSSSGALAAGNVTYTATGS